MQPQRTARLSFDEHRQNTRCVSAIRTIQGETNEGTRFYATARTRRFVAQLFRSEGAATWRIPRSQTNLVAFRLSGDRLTGCSDEAMSCQRILFRGVFDVNPPQSGEGWREASGVERINLTLWMRKTF